jgi:hypothetical protein
MAFRTKIITALLSSLLFASAPSQGFADFHVPHLDEVIPPPPPPHVPHLDEVIPQRPKVHVPHVDEAFRDRPDIRLPHPDEMSKDGFEQGKKLFWQGMTTGERLLGRHPKLHDGQDPAPSEGEIWSTPDGKYSLGLPGSDSIDITPPGVPGEDRTTHTKTWRPGGDDI